MGRTRSFPCSWTSCKKVFNRKSDLCRHYRIHTNERPYTCDFPKCSKSFIQRSALTVHSRTHTGEKPHVCDHDNCGKAFSDSSSLARHRRIHTGRRPYRCEEPACDRSFCRKTTLIKHQNRSHQGDSPASPASSVPQEHTRHFIPSLSPAASLKIEVSQPFATAPYPTPTLVSHDFPRIQHCAVPQLPLSPESPMIKHEVNYVGLGLVVPHPQITHFDMSGAVMDAVPKYPQTTNIQGVEMMPNFIPMPPMVPYHPSDMLLDKPVQSRFLSQYQDRATWEFLGLES